MSPCFECGAPTPFAVTVDGETKVVCSEHNPLRLEISHAELDEINAHLRRMADKEPDPQ